MRNAPSVNFPVGRCAFYGRLLLALGFLGAVALLGPILMVWWGQATSLQGTTWIAGGLLWLGWSSWAWRHWRASPVGMLRWDAQAAGLDSQPGAWRWLPGCGRAPITVRRLECVWDGQSRCWLRLHGIGRYAQWMWVERSRDRARWDDLRRALVAAR